MFLCAIDLVYRFVKNQNGIPGERTHPPWFLYLTIGIKVDMSLMLSYPVRRSPKGLSLPRSFLFASSINTDGG